MAKSNFVTDAHDKMYSTTVRQLREDLGRKVKIFLPGNPTVCPNCLFNSVDGKSAGIYSPTSPYPAGTPGPTPFQTSICPVCHGSGQYTRTIVKEILCHIRWINPEALQHSSLGDIMGADCRLQSDIKYLQDFRRPPMKIEVDGFSMELVKVYPRGLKKLAQVIAFLKFSPHATPGNKNRTTYGETL